MWFSRVLSVLKSDFSLDCLNFDIINGCKSHHKNTEAVVKC